MTKDEQQQLTDRMNALAKEMGPLKPNDPRRAEIVKELSRLSLLTASAKEEETDV